MRWIREEDGVADTYEGNDRLTANFKRWWLTLPLPALPRSLLICSSRMVGPGLPSTTTVYKMHDINKIENGAIHAFSSSALFGSFFLRKKLAVFVKQRTHDFIQKCKSKTSINI